MTPDDPSIPPPPPGTPNAPSADASAARSAAQAGTPFDPPPAAPFTDPFAAPSTDRPSAPPTVPVEVHHAPRPVWPKVMGIALIAVNGFLALGALLTAIMQLLSLFLMDFTQSSMMAASTAELQATNAVTRAFAIPVSAVALVELLINLLGLWAGIRIVNHNPRGPSLATKWALLKLVYALGRVALVIFMQYRVMDVTMSGVMTGATNPPPAAMAGAMTGMAVTMAVITGFFYLAIAWVMPLVWLLFWARSSPREQVRGWGDAS